jgi:phasin family protein
MNKLKKLGGLMAKDKFTNPFWGDSFPHFKESRFPWFDSDLMLSSYRRNVDLINTTQQIAAETTKAVIELQAAYMKDIFEQLSEQSKRNFSTFSPEERVAQQKEATKTTFNQAMEHARNVNSLISQSNEKIMENVQKRFKESIDESGEYATKPRTKTKT